MLLELPNSPSAQVGLISGNQKDQEMAYEEERGETVGNVIGTHDEVIEKQKRAEQENSLTDDRMGEEESVLGEDLIDQAGVGLEGHMECGSHLLIYSLHLANK